MQYKIIFIVITVAITSRHRVCVPFFQENASEEKSAKRVREKIPQQHCNAQPPKKSDPKKATATTLSHGRTSIQITQSLEQKSRETKLQKSNPSIASIVERFAEILQPPQGRRSLGTAPLQKRKFGTGGNFGAAPLEKRKIRDHLEEEADDVIMVLNSSKLTSPSPFLSTPVIMFSQSSRVLPSPMPLRTW